MQTLRAGIFAAVVALAATVALAPSANAGGGSAVACCECDGCMGGPVPCFNNPENDDVCDAFCVGYGCFGGNVTKTLNGCTLGDPCDQIIFPGASHPSPVLSPLGFGLAALLAFVAGANEVRRRARRRG